MREESVGEKKRKERKLESHDPVPALHSFSPINLPTRCFPPTSWQQQQQLWSFSTSSLPGLRSHPPSFLRLLKPFLFTSALCVSLPPRCTPRMSLLNSTCSQLCTKCALKNSSACAFRASTTAELWRLCQVSGVPAVTLTSSRSPSIRRAVMLPRGCVSPIRLAQATIRSVFFFW